MIKLYFKQAFHLLGENKLLSSISIIGTALAIAMIMVIVITLRITEASVSGLRAEAIRGSSLSGCISATSTTMCCGRAGRYTGKSRET